MNKSIIFSGNSESSLFLIQNNTFKNCSSLNGGAISIIDQGVFIIYNTFTVNNASLGGALYFECPSKNNCLWNLTGLIKIRKNINVFM